MAAFPYPNRVVDSKDLRNKHNAWSFVSRTILSELMPSKDGGYAIMQEQLLRGFIIQLHQLYGQASRAISTG